MAQLFEYWWVKCSRIDRLFSGTDAITGWQFVDNDFNSLEPATGATSAATDVAGASSANKNRHKVFPLFLTPRIVQRLDQGANMQVMVGRSLVFTLPRELVDAFVSQRL